MPSSPLPSSKCRRILTWRRAVRAAMIAAAPSHELPSMPLATGTASTSLHVRLRLLLWRQPSAPKNMDEELFITNFHAVEQDTVEDEEESSDEDEDEGE
jgi:hypothetical protein